MNPLSLVRAIGVKAGKGKEENAKSRRHTVSLLTLTDSCRSSIPIYRAFIFRPSGPIGVQLILPHSAPQPISSLDFHHHAQLLNFYKCFRTFSSSACPSKSTKKTYSHAFRARGQRLNLAHIDCVVFQNLQYLPQRANLILNPEKDRGSVVASGCCRVASNNQKTRRIIWSIHDRLSHHRTAHKSRQRVDWLLLPYSTHWLPIPPLPMCWKPQSVVRLTYFD